MSESEIEERDKDIDVARMQTREAREAVEDGEYLDAIEAASSVIGFAARAAKRDDPVATLVVDYAGSRDPERVEITPGDHKSVEVHGKATLRMEGYSRYEEGSE